EEQIRDIDILIGEKREILDEQQSLSLEVLQAAETPLDEGDAVLDFELSCNSYADSLDNVHFEGNIHKGVENMKILAKLFYPTENIGATVAALVENLLQAEQNEKYINELGK
ncbi:15659_t:CDS:2, partial [Racocetra fulgida]